MARPDRWISAKTIALQYALSREVGVAEEDLAALGLAEADLANLDARVSEDVAYRHLELVATTVPIEPFVVELARRHRMTTLGLPGFGMRTAATVRGGMETLVRYQHLTNALAVFELVIADERSALWIEHRHAPSSLGAMLATEVSMLVGVNIAREMNAAFAPTSLDIRRDIDPPAVYEAFVGSPITTGASRGAMRFETSLLDAPMQTADADLRDYFERELDRQAAFFATTAPLVLELRRALGAELLHGTPSIDGAARALGVSRRTLQRRLSDQDTSFAVELDALRADLARGYLKNPAYTISEIGFLLGYSDISSFYRAFRRWTGTTPEAYRSSDD